MKLNVNENLIGLSERNLNTIQEETENFLITEEGMNIKTDIELLKSIGFNKQMINKVYIILRP